MIDWSHATQGNGSADAARTYLLFQAGRQGRLGELYLKMFCDINDVAKQYVSQWLPIVCSISAGKAESPEKEFLMRWSACLTISNDKSEQSHR